MNKFRYLAAGAVMLAGIGTAAAQQAVVISPENEVVIREYVVRQQVVPVAPPAGAQIIVGETLPEVVEMRPLNVPEIGTTYNYVVLDGRTVLVEPETRRIVHILQ